MTNHIQVKNTEVYKNSQGEHIVCKGKLVSLKNKILWKSCKGSILDGKTETTILQRYAIVSETEKIEVGDKMYNSKFNSVVEAANDSLVNLKGIDGSYCAKILALPRDLSQEQLQDIVDGKLKVGDEVYVVCENICIQTGIRCGYPCNGDCQETGYQFTKLTDNHITLFPVK